MQFVLWCNMYRSEIVVVIAVYKTMFLVPPGSGSTWLKIKCNVDIVIKSFSMFLLAFMPKPYIQSNRVGIVLNQISYGTVLSLAHFDVGAYTNEQDNISH